MTYTYLATQSLGWFVDQVQAQDQRWTLHYYDWDDRQAKVITFDEVYFARGYFWTCTHGTGDDMRWGQGYVGIIEREVPEDKYRIRSHDRQTWR